MIPNIHEMKNLMDSERRAKEQRKAQHEEVLYTNSLHCLDKLLREAAREGCLSVEITVSFGLGDNYKRFEDYVISQGYKIRLMHSSLSNTYRISW